MLWDILSSLILFPLGLRSQHCMGQFEVKQAMKEITELCYSFSSLIVSYNDVRGELQHGKMHPILDTLDIHVTDVTDSGRFELVIQLLERGKPKLSPHPEVEKWLKSL